MAQPILVSATPSATEPRDDESASIYREILEGLPSWLTSFTCHLVLFVLLALISVVGGGLGDGFGVGVEVEMGGSSGAGGDTTGPGDALATLAESAPLEAPESTLNAAIPLAALAEETLDPHTPPLDLAGLTPAATPSVTPPSAGDGAGRGAGVGDGEGDGDGLEGGGGLIPVPTQVFGMAAEGTRFVYVFDHSESMNSSIGYTSECQTVSSITPLIAAKAELLRSLDDLGPQQRFQIVFYNHEPTIFPTSYGVKRLMPATKLHKDQATSFVSNMVGEGGTYHLEPLEIALRLKPDVIFLLTDGEAKDDPPSYHVARLTQLNAGRAKIYVIQFCFVPREDGTLITLAKQNGGKHVFFNISRLGPGLPGAAPATPAAPEKPGGIPTTKLSLP